MTKRNIIAIVPAAGIGSRMQREKPKQYLLLNGQTILQHTLDVLLNYRAIQKVILVVAKDDPYIESLVLAQNPRIEITIGGSTRADSVFAGLQLVPANSWVLVHDAARPCLTHQDLDKLLQIEDENGAILACPVTDTIKRTAHFLQNQALQNQSPQIVATEDRTCLWHALTPQFFPAELLKNAYAHALANQLTLTDEASAMELLGYRPHLISGRSDNLKITRPEDLALAEFYLQQFYLQQSYLQKGNTQ